MDRSNKKDFASASAALWRRADRQARRGRAAEALRLYEQAAEQSGNARLDLRIGRTRHGLGDLVGARDAYQKAAAKAPEEQPARFFEALVDLDEGRESQTIERLDSVIAAQPENYAAHCLRALAEFRRENGPKPFLAWERYFSAHTEFLVRLVETMEAARLAESSRGDASGAPSAGSASEDANAANQPSDETRPHQSDHPHHPPGHPAQPGALETVSKRRLLKMASLALEKEDHALALAAARKLVALRPRDYEARYALGWVALDAGRPDEAQRALGMAARFERRQRLRERLKPFRRATRRRVRKMTESAPLNPALLSLRALALARVGRTDEARRLLAQTPVEGPESYNRFYIIGVCALADGCRVEARRFLRHAFEAYGVDTIELCLPDVMRWARRRYCRAAPSLSEETEGR